VVFFDWKPESYYEEEVGVVKNGWYGGRPRLGEIGEKGQIIFHDGSSVSFDGLICRRSPRPMTFYFQGFKVSES
jgi:hypothetical protein